MEWNEVSQLLLFFRNTIPYLALKKQTNKCSINEIEQEMNNNKTIRLLKYTHIPLSQEFILIKGKFPANTGSSKITVYPFSLLLCSASLSSMAEFLEYFKSLFMIETLLNMCEFWETPVFDSYFRVLPMQNPSVLGIISFSCM